MPCLENTLGPEAYFATLAVLVGALVNLIKRSRFVPVDAVPVLAFMLGWALDGALSNMACGLNYTEAALSSLGGGLAGLSAAGGHEALSRTARAFGYEDRAGRLLGRAKKEQDKRISKSVGLLVLLLALSGCAGVLEALSRAQQGAQYLDTVIKVAEGQADSYFARHPNRDREFEVDAALRRSRLALAALDAALATADAVDAEDVARAKLEARRAYAALRSLLDEFGVLSATAPEGGAESDAPAPEPVALPTADQVLP